MCVCVVGVQIKGFTEAGLSDCACNVMRVCCQSSNKYFSDAGFNDCACACAEARKGFSAVYDTVAFKESEARVFLSAPVTAKILEVERFTSAQDRFDITAQRSVNKVDTLARTPTHTHTR